MPNVIWKVHVLIHYRTSILLENWIQYRRFNFEIMGFKRSMFRILYYSQGGKSYATGEPIVKNWTANATKTCSETNHCSWPASSHVTQKSLDHRHGSPVRYIELHRYQARRYWTSCNSYYMFAVFMIIHTMSGRDSQQLSTWAILSVHYHLQRITHLQESLTAGIEYLCRVVSPILMIHIYSAGVCWR